MTAEERYGIAAQVLAQALAERVVQKLVERQKKALVVFTGSNMGEQASLKSLASLRSHGFTFHVLLTRSAATILDQDEIRTLLHPESFWIQQADESPEVLTMKYDTIIVPTLTVNAVAHLANCMADTPATAIIFDGMMRGKNVIAAIDGCCPDNSLRAERGFSMAEPLKQKLRDNMEVLRSYGAKLTTAERLAEKTLSAIHGPLMKEHIQSPAPSCVARSPAVIEGSTTVYQGGKVLSGAYLAISQPHSTLLVPKGTLVTQMATDEARRRDITIQIQT